MAFRAGAVLRDLEMIQFHPTTLYVAGAARELISEAVRGEGAFLVNRTGRRFMAEYDERSELAPRDVVSRAIAAEMKREQSSCVYLDVRHFPAGRFAARFPSLDRLCHDFDIDPQREPDPVRRVPITRQGGSWWTSRGKRACAAAGLWGSGFQRLHGANRLASNRC